MARTFRKWDVDQAMLLPASVNDLVPEGHLSPSGGGLVRDSLDLAAIVNRCTGEGGIRPVTRCGRRRACRRAYCQGVCSSRKIVRACGERVGFTALTALQKTGFGTAGEFRGRHLEALGRLFVQVLRLCAEAGLVEMGHEFLDGTKIEADASRQRAMSCGRMKKVRAPGVPRVPARAAVGA